jgi:hypothetical protein
VRKGSSFATNQRTNLSRNALGDIIVVDIKRWGLKMTRIVNIYNQRQGETGERPARRLNGQRFIRQGGGGMVLPGDFNTNSKCWDPRCTELRDATYREAIIGKHRVVIGNDDWPTHYWTRHNSMGESVIDLTLANRPLEKWMIQDGSHATGSDHEIIEWELEMEKQEEPGGTQVVGWKLAAMSQEDVDVAEALWRERAKAGPYLEAESPGDEVESEAEWCQEALSKVLDATAKKITICAHSKRWWNGEIKEKRSQLGREKRRRRMSVPTAQAKSELQKTVWRAKDTMWNDYLKNLRGAEVCRAAKFASPQAEMTLEALTDRDGKQPNTIAAKKEMLRQESFPQMSTTNTSNYPRQAKHTSPSVSKRSREPCSRSSSNKRRARTNCLLEPYAYSGSGTKRELWSLRRQPSGRADTHQSGRGRVGS